MFFMTCFFVFLVHGHSKNRVKSPVPLMAHQATKAKALTGTMGGCFARQEKFSGRKELRCTHSFSLSLFLAPLLSLSLSFSLSLPFVLPSSVVKGVRDPAPKLSAVTL